MGKSSKNAGRPFLPLIITGLKNQQKVLPPPSPAHPISPSIEEILVPWHTQLIFHVPCQLSASSLVHLRQVHGLLGRHGSSKIKLKWKNMKIMKEPVRKNGIWMDLGMFLRSPVVIYLQKFQLYITVNWDVCWLSSISCSWNPRGLGDQIDEIWNFGRWRPTSCWLPKKNLYIYIYDIYIYIYIYISYIYIYIQIPAHKTSSNSHAGLPKAIRQLISLGFWEPLSQAVLRVRPVGSQPVKPRTRRAEVSSKKQFFYPIGLTKTFSRRWKNSRCY